jgi:hypothetical protein
MNTTSISTVSLQIGDPVPDRPKNTVTFICKYSTDYKGLRTLEEGKAYEVAADAAEFLTEKGLGHLEGKEVVEETPVVVTSKPKAKK